MLGTEKWAPRSPDAHSIQPGGSASAEERRSKNRSDMLTNHDQNHALTENLTEMTW